MKFLIAKGTVGKLIKLLPNAEPEVVNWTTRKDLSFSESLINPIVVKTMVNNSNKPLAVRMADQGYALFGGDTGGDRDAAYVLAIPYNTITIQE